MIFFLWPLKVAQWSLRESHVQAAAYPLWSMPFESDMVIRSYDVAFSPVTFKSCLVTCNTNFCLVCCSALFIAFWICCGHYGVRCTLQANFFSVWPLKVGFPHIISIYALLLYFLWCQHLLGKKRHFYPKKNLCRELFF